MITKMPSCSQVLWISGCWESCIRSRIISTRWLPEYHLDLWTWLNSVQMRTPTGSRWVSNNYITRYHRRLGSVSSSSVPVAVGDRMPVEWEPAPDRGLGPSATHGWAALPRWGRSAAMVVRRTFGQYVAVCLRLQLTSHTQPTSTLSNKVLEVYFYKEVCSFVHWRSDIMLTMFLHIVVLWIYNKKWWTTASK